MGVPVGVPVPAAAVTTALQFDVLRSSDWIYNRTVAPEYPFAYPAPLTSAGLFLFVSVVALSISALRLRRAYREEAKRAGAKASRL